MNFLAFLTYVKHLGEKALVFFPTKTDYISVVDNNGNPTEEMLSERLETINNTYAPIANPTFTGSPTAPTPESDSNDTSLATTAFVKEQIEGLGSDSLVADILNVFVNKKENTMFKLIYPSHIGNSGRDSICTSVYPNAGDYFYLSEEKYVSYAGRKVTLGKGWYKIKTDIASLDPDNINVMDVYPYPLFCHPVVAYNIGFEDPEFITMEESGINSIIQEEERLGNILFTKQYELKDAPECVKEENQYLGESGYWCPGITENKAVPKGSIWYVNDNTDTAIGYYQAKIDIGYGIMSAGFGNSGVSVCPSPDPYETFYFEYLGTSYKVYAGMPNSNYKRVQRDTMLEEIRKILENHIK